MTDTVKNVYESLCRVLLRCWIGGFVLLVVWMFAIQFGDETIYRLQGSLFHVTKHELDVMMYGALGLFKMGVLLFFFLPWLALWLELRRWPREPQE